MIGAHHFLVVSALMFAIGLYGMLTRRSVLMIILCIELVLNAANLSFVTFSSYSRTLDGQIVVFFTMIVAAAEVTVGLAIVMLMYRKKKSTRADNLNLLKW